MARKIMFDMTFLNLPDVVRIRREFGHEGIAYAVEVMLYLADSKHKSFKDADAYLVADTLKIDEVKFIQLLSFCNANAMQLLCKSEDVWSSPYVDEDLGAYDAKVERLRENAKKRWSKSDQIETSQQSQPVNAIAMQLDSNCIASPMQIIVEKSREEQCREEQRRAEKSREEKDLALKEENAAKLEWPPEIETPECREKWHKWLSYKRQIKKPYKSPMSENGQLKRLAAMGPERMLGAIEFSISQGWEGVHEESRPRAGPTSTTHRGPKSAKQTAAEMIARGEI